MTAVIPVPGTGGHETVVYAAQVGASGVVLLELGEGLGEDLWHAFVCTVLRRLGGRPLWAVPPLVLTARGSGQRVIGEVMGCRIGAPDPPAERVLLARLETVRGQTWPAGFGESPGRSDALLRSWEDEVNGSPLPGLGQTSRELFERLDRKRLRPLHPGRASE